MKMGDPRYRAHVAGSIFTALLAATAMAGALSFMVYQVLAGPVATMARATKKATADEQMSTVAKLLISSSGSTDCDSDNYIEPPERVTATVAPTGGGTLPVNLGAPLTDPWGTPYGYCVWNTGSWNHITGDVTDHGCGATASEKRLAGASEPSTGTNGSNTVLAVISAGPDRHFDTTCSAWSSSSADVIAVAAGKDDLVTRYTYPQAQSAIPGVWSLSTATAANVAQLGSTNRALEVGDDTQQSATGLITAKSFTAGGGVIAAGGGLQLATQTSVTTCDASNVGTLRYNTTLSPVGIEYCMGGGTPAWTVIGTGSGAGATTVNGIDYLQDAIADYTTYVVGLGRCALNKYSSTTHDDANCGAAAAATGTNNTAVGESALNVVSTGSNNTGLGYQALLLATTGSNNTAVGYQALRSLVAGNANTALGYSSLPVAATAPGGGALTLRGVTTATGGITITVNKPAGTVAGDVIVFAVDADWSTSIGWPAGFTPLEAAQWGCEDGGYGVAYKVADGTEGASFQAVVPGNSFGATGLIASYGGVDTSVAIAHLDTMDASHIAVTPYPVTGSVTTAAANSQVLFFAFLEPGPSEGSTGRTLTPPTGFTNRGLVDDTWSPIFFADKNIAAVGATGTLSASINVPSPGGPLNACVSGTVLALAPLTAGASTASGNTAAGYQAQNGNIGGVYNTAAGYQALMNNAYGVRNTAAGYQALMSNFSGSDNAAAGYQALAAYTGNGNTAMGYKALAVATGAGNTVLGSNTGIAITSGTNNTIMGASAVVTETVGNDLTVLSGAGWAFSGTDHSGMTAIGDSSLNAASSAGSTAVGAGALSKATSALRNTAIGYNALTNQTTASDETAVGWEALYNDQPTGDDQGGFNVAVGYSALYAQNDSSYWSGGSTAIGYNALALKTSDAATGRIAIGSGAMANSASAIGGGSSGAPVVIGYHAGYGVTTGVLGVAIGYNANSGAVTTANSTNTAIGSNALLAGTSGSNTVAVGHNALLNTTTASDGFAVGYNAGLSSQQMNSATAMGYRAMYCNNGANESYNNDIAVGSNAYTVCGPAASNDSHFIGSGAGQNASGDTHSGIGYQALQNSAGNNIAIGWKAAKNSINNDGYDIVLGADTVSTGTVGDGFNAIGYQALQAWNANGVSSSYFSHAIGYQALMNNVAGVDSYAMGYQAGINIVGSSNTALGYQTLYNDTGYMTTVTGAASNGGIRLTVTSTANFATGDAVDVTSVGGVPNAMGAWTITVNDATHLTLQGSTWGSSSYTSGGYVVAFQGNTAAGARSGYGITTGKQNSALGYLAGPPDDSIAPNVTGAANNGGGLIRLAMPDTASLSPRISITSAATSGGLIRLAISTVGTNGLVTGDKVYVNGSVPNANGAWTINYVDATHVDLQGSTFSATGTGVLTAFVPFRVTAAANNGSNLIRLTVPSTASLATGDSVGVANVGGVPNATGTWTITVINGTQVDLQGSTWGGGWTSVGTLAPRVAVSGVGGVGAATGTWTPTVIDSTHIDLVGSAWGGGYTSGGSVCALSSSNASCGTLTNTIAIGYNAKVYKSNTVRVGNSNVTWIGGQVAWTATSDRRIKKDIKDSDIGLDFIEKLRPVSYRLKTGNGRLDYGFIAQEVEQALDGRVTNMITQDADPDKTYMMRHADLIAPLVRGMQQQEKADEKLQADIEAVKAELLRIHDDLADPGRVKEAAP